MDVDLVNAVKHQVIEELKKEYFLVKKTNEFSPDDKIKSKTFLNYVTSVVSDYYKVSKETVLTNTRVRDFVVVRQIVFLLCRDVCKPPISFKQIGEYFGKDHVTVIYGYKEMLRISEVDKNQKQDIDKLKEIIKNDFYKEVKNN